MAYLNARPNINSLFGFYSIPENQSTVGWDSGAATNAMAYDYVLRDKNGKESMQATIKKSDIVINALTAPVDFLKKKRENLREIADHLEKKYPMILQRELNKNKTIKDARKEALSVIDKKFDKKMKKHNEIYQKELLGKIVRKLVG